MFRKTVPQKIRSFIQSKQGKITGGVLAALVVVVTCFFVVHAAAGKSCKSKSLAYADSAFSSAMAQSLTASSDSDSAAAVSSVPANSISNKTAKSSVSAGIGSAAGSTIGTNGATVAAQTQLNGSERTTARTTQANTTGKTGTDTQAPTNRFTGSSGKTGSGSTRQSSGSAGGNTSGHSSGSGSGSSQHVANYQGVNKTMYFTDEITGIQQKVEFLGMGAGYQEVAAANFGVNTTPAMGSAHSGNFKAVYIVVGTNGHKNVLSGQAVAADGNNPVIVDGNLTAGTYTVQVKAGDGTVVAQYRFTVDSSGIVH